MLLVLHLIEFITTISKGNRYLYERENYDLASTVIEAASDNITDKSSLAYAGVVDLSGLILLNTNNPNEALEKFTETLHIRESVSSRSDSLIALSLNNMAVAYTELGQLEKSYDAHTKAIEIRLNVKSSSIRDSYSNMASLLLRMEKADEAEEMLKKCPSPESLNERFLIASKPRFSGETVLLSRIRHRQGRLDEAAHLSSMALQLRQRLHGNRLRTCESLYDVAYFTHKQGVSDLPL